MPPQFKYLEQLQEIRQYKYKIEAVRASVRDGRAAKLRVGSADDILNRSVTIYFPGVPRLPFERLKSWVDYVFFARLMVIKDHCDDARGLERLKTLQKRLLNLGSELTGHMPYRGFSLFPDESDSEEMRVGKRIFKVYKALDNAIRRDLPLDDVTTKLEAVIPQTPSPSSVLSAVEQDVYPSIAFAHSKVRQIQRDRELMGTPEEKEEYVTELSEARKACGALVKELNSGATCQLDPLVVTPASRDRYSKYLCAKQVDVLKKLPMYKVLSKRAETYGKRSTTWWRPGKKKNAERANKLFDLLYQLEHLDLPLWEKVDRVRAMKYDKLFKRQRKTNDQLNDLHTELVTYQKNYEAGPSIGSQVRKAVLQAEKNATERAGLLAAIADLGEQPTVEVPLAPTASSTNVDSGVDPDAEAHELAVTPSLPPVSSSPVVPVSREASAASIDTGVEADAERKVSREYSAASTDTAVTTTSVAIGSAPATPAAAKPKTLYSTVAFNNHCDAFKGGHAAAGAAIHTSTASA